MHVRPRLPPLLAAAVVLVAVAVIIDSMAGLGAPLRVLSIRPSMPPTTAACLGLIGAALILQTPGPGRSPALAATLAAVASAWSALTLVEYATGRDLGINLPLASAAVSAGSRLGAPVRMEAPAATALLLCGVGLILVTATSARRLRLAGCALATSALLIATVVVLAHVLAALGVDVGNVYASVTLPTALALAALAVAIPAFAPDIGWARLLVGPAAGLGPAGLLRPATIALPPVLGWLLVEGSRVDLATVDARLAVDALGTASLLTAIVLWTVYRIDAAHAGRLAGETMFRRALEDSPFPAMVHAEDGSIVVLNREWLANTGYRREQISSVAAWSTLAYGQQRAADLTAEFDLVYASQEPIDLGHHVIRVADGSSRVWSVRSSHLGRDAAGRRLLLTKAVDVTDHKLAEERQRLLMREVDHRAKNALSVVQAIVRLTRDRDPATFAAAVEGRVNAMATAHTLLAGNKWSGVDLSALLALELAMFGDAGERVLCAGPAVTISPDATQALTLVVHELAANAARHGAMSTMTGQVAVEWSIQHPGEPGRVAGRVLRIVWRERGAAIAGPPARRGFGSTLIEQTINRQLAGAVEMDWRTEGLLCTLTLPETCFSSPVPGPVAGGKMRILVVEDEPLVALVADAILTDAGYDVLGPVGRVKEALDLLRYQRPDASVLDVNLGGETAFPIADRLVELGVPFLFCTGYAILDQLPDGLRHAPVVAKPIDRRFVDAVSSLLAPGTAAAPAEPARPPAARSTSG